MSPRVKEVGMFGESVRVFFDDGHEAEFGPYFHGLGYSCEGLRTFVLKHAGGEVFHYNARLNRSGACADEHVVTHIATGYDQKRAASYWQAARDYLDANYAKKPDAKRNQNLWFPWLLVGTEGSHDLTQLAKGEARQK